METQKIREILGRLAGGEGRLELRLRSGGGPEHIVAPGAVRPLETAVAADATGRRAVLRFAAGLTIEIGRATLAIRWSAPESDEFAGGLAAQAGAEAIGDARQAPAVCGTIAAVGGSFYDLRADLPAGAIDTVATSAGRVTLTALFAL